MNRRVGAACVAALLVVALAPSVEASHYRLGRTGLVSAAEIEALGGLGVHTTLELFQHSARLTDRRQIAKQSGLSFARLTELATQCDLLRIEGVGPSIVRLLQAAGVRHAADLRKARAAALRSKLVATNTTHKLTEVVPDVGNLTGWIEQARALPKVLEGVR